MHMFVYDPGRDLMAKGIVPAGNMLPEVACVKLAWALGQTTDLGRVKDLMLTPSAGEITEREPNNGYWIFQGGIAEVEEFSRKFHK
jgi:glutamyl-tRNA(Gln) amidotransferase subunit D